MLTEAIDVHLPAVWSGVCFVLVALHASDTCMKNARSSRVDSRATVKRPNAARSGTGPFDGILPAEYTYR